MSFTKILGKSIPNIVFEDLLCTIKREPNFIITNRFKAFQVKIIFPKEEIKHNALWLVQANDIKQERALLFFKLNATYNSVDSFKILNSGLDTELLSYLTKGLFIQLYNSNTYHFPVSVFEIR